MELLRCLNSLPAWNDGLFLKWATEVSSSRLAVAFISLGFGFSLAMNHQGIMLHIAQRVSARVQRKATCVIFIFIRSHLPLCYSALKLLITALTSPHKALPHQSSSACPEPQLCSPPNHPSPPSSQVSTAPVRPSATAIASQSDTFHGARPISKLCQPKGLSSDTFPCSTVSPSSADEP